MKIAIMQPYFFPYLGYFALIKNTDRFILLDEVQYIRHGWINRNRILKPIYGWQYIIVPLTKQPRDTLIKDSLINNTLDWRQKIIAQLQHYKKKAPYFKAVIQLLDDSFTQFSDVSLTSLNYLCLKKVCEYIGLDTPIDVFSEMGVTLPEIKAPDEWALFISKELKAQEYINPEAGALIFDPRKYYSHNIKLTFLGIDITSYNQERETFESSLSIIDVMMFNSPEVIRNMLSRVRYLKPDDNKET